MPSSVTLILIAFIALLVAYIRLAPHATDNAHRSLDFHSDEPLTGGIKKVVTADLTALNDIILREPRTKVIAGSVDTGHITYVSRSLLWGFPDYTTVQRVEDQETTLRIFARLRFGKSDLGTNAERVERWLSELDAQTVSKRLTTEHPHRTGSNSPAL